jgi:hypothetical protein
VCKYGKPSQNSPEIQDPTIVPLYPKKNVILEILGQIIKEVK